MTIIYPTSDLGTGANVFGKAHMFSVEQVDAFIANNRGLQKCCYIGGLTL